MILRCVRSPDAPKTTSTHGSGVRRCPSPSSSGFSTAGASVTSRLRLDGVAAELLAQRGVDLRRERLVLARGEARVERGGDDRSGHVLVDRLEDRPTALARVVHVAGDVLEAVAVLGERVMQELEEPGAHDRAVAPDPRDLLEVELELRCVQHLEPLGVRLHEAVLDAVVHHLHEVPGPGRPDVRPAVGRRERLERGLDAADGLVGPTGHQAEPLLQAPDPSGDADVEEVDPLLGRLRVSPLRVVEVRVPSVDQHVVLVEDPHQLARRVLRDLSGRDHHPDDPRRLQLLRELLERRGGRLHLRVVRHHVVPVAAQALRHPGAHPSEADHPELHRSSSLTRQTFRPRSFNDSRSPVAWAAISSRKPKSLPGIASSSPKSSTTWIASTLFGPPLWSCPVECRYRGPRPLVTTQPVSRARVTSGSSSPSRSGSMRAWIAMYCGGSASASNSSSDPSGPVSGPGPGTWLEERRSAVLSFASCTSGWPNGLMPRIEPATAVANSQRKNSAPRSYGSSSRTRPCCRSGPPVGSSPGAGTSPLPLFPVDSAISCSAQSPKPPGTSSMHTLSRPSLQLPPSSAPNWKPGFSSPRRHQPAIATARSSSSWTSIPISVAGAIPNGDSAE